MNNWLSRLAPPVRGQLYMVWSCILFSLLWILIRYASETMHPFLIILYRNIFALFALLPFLLRNGQAAFSTGRFRFHMVRGVISTVAVFGTFYAIATIPLADAVAISYASPVFAAIGAVLIFGERLHMRRIMAVVIGFAGVLIIIRPGFEAIDLGTAAALIAALAISAAILVVKALTTTEKPEVIVFYAQMVILPVSLIAALLVWRLPTLEELALLALIGFLVKHAQTSTAHAFALAEATAILPINFIRLVIAIWAGVVLFDESLDPLTIAGGIVILAATVYFAHRERVLAHRETSIAPRLPPFG